MAATKLGDITLTKKSGTTLTLETKGKYVDEDVFFNISAQSGAGAVTISSADADVEADGGSGDISGSIGAKSSTAPSSGHYIKVVASSTGSSTITTAGWLNTGSLGTATGSANVYFPIEDATASISGTNTVTPTASVSGTNVTLSNTNNGISVTATGGGTASASVAAMSTAPGYVEDNQQICTGLVAAASSSTSASVYISGVTMTAPSSGTRTFSITVPKGNTTATFVFNVDSSGNVTITES